VEAEFADGVLTTYRQHDLWGRITALKEGPGPVQRTWWHANGTKAISGTVGSPGGDPEGTWTEWDEAGGQIGQLTFANGTHGPLKGSARTLLYAGADDGFLSPAPDSDLPKTTSTVLPPLAVNLVVTPAEVSVDGDWVVDLEAGAVAEADLRGHLIQPLYDRLLTKAETAESLAAASGHPDHAHEGRILVQADRDHPWSLLRQVLYTCGQAQFDQLLFVGRVEDVQWPPRTGPAWQQGAHPLAVTPVALPAIASPGSESPSSQGRTPVIEIRATDLQLYTLTNGEPSAPPQTIHCRGACDGNGLDIEALRDALRPIKAEEARTTQLILLPGPDTPLHVLIHVVDGVRSDRDSPLFSEVVLGGWTSWRR